uniref:Uncharacterized protein n=1 Tax=Kalanchoe fedtschenkoi TaxID=63787 RepID=A0A7N0TEJ1_KALFE
MLGDGGKLYWVWNRARKKADGIAVLFAWVSVHGQHLKSYVDLYGELGWDSLVCSADFFNAFDPEKAASLAFCVLLELVQELRRKAHPVVFVAFSGGSKACLYKVFQIVQGVCDVQLNQEDNQLLRSCLSGIVFDSSPLDFTSDFAARFVMHPSILKLPGASKLVSWVAKGVSSGLDALFLTGFESQRAEYWHALHSSVRFGAPYLILSSETDDLAPWDVISCFVQHLRNAGGDVKFVKWNDSHHVDHYKHHLAEYKAATKNLLEKAGHVFSRKVRQLEIERTGIQCMHDDESELFQNVHKSPVKPNRTMALEKRDHLFLPGPKTLNGDSTAESSQNETSLQLVSPPGINPHSVLGKVLFDACVPKNIEGWDIKFNCTVNGQPLATARRHSPSLGIKYNRRSKL